MRNRLPVLLVAAALLPGGIQAQDVDLGDFSDLSELSLTDLLDVTVSIAAAGRILSLEEAPSIVSVITAEDIRRMGAQNLEDVLETVPGFEVLTDEIGRRRISVRGVFRLGTTEDVLVLLNGLRLNEQLWGGATGVHFNFPVQNLKQIEVIRGPGSALYGSNAVIGVVNLVTWDAGTFDGTEVSATGGSFDTRQVVVTSARTLGALSLSGSFQYRQTEGYQLRIEQDAMTPIDDINVNLGRPRVSLAPGRTADDRQEFDGQLRAVYNDFTIDAVYSDHHSGGFVGRLNALGIGNETDARQAHLAVAWNRELNPSTRLTASTGYMWERFAEFGTPIPAGFVHPVEPITFPEGAQLRFKSDLWRLNGGLILEHRTSADNSLTVGVGAEYDATLNTETFANFDPTATDFSPLPPETRLEGNVVPTDRRTVLSAFAQDTWNPTPALGVTGGVRFDHYDDFGSTVNPRLGLVWRLHDDVHFKALYGRAFRAPTFSELGFAFSNLVGNPDLRPSIINTVEAALGYRRSNLRLGVNYFATFIRDFIGPTDQLSISQLTDTLTYFNSEGIDVRGVEVEARRSFGFEHDIFANYTYQRVTDLELDGPPRGGGLEHLANVGFTYGLGDYISVSPVLHVRGERARYNLDPRPPVPSYAVLHVNTRLFNVFETLELSVSLRNALDQEYVDPAVPTTMPDDYPMPGRHLFVKVNYKF